nr:hypothetical protein [Tanacetum cinerariifolium]
MDYIHTTEAKLGINLDIPLSKQDPLDKLNDLANKKRKHADYIHDYFKANKRLKSSVQYEDHLPGTVLNEPILGIFFNSYHRQDFVTIEDFRDFSNTMVYTVQEIFFKLHQGPRLDDHARTFSSLLLAEINKRNLNPLKQMRVIEQLRVGPLSGKSLLVIVVVDAECLSSYTKGWTSFVKRSDADPVCHSIPLDSVKNWNDYLFWVDSMAFPLSVSLKSKILKIDLFAFIRHSNPTKVRIKERDLAKREGHSVERNDDILEETITKDVSEVAVEKIKKSKRKRKINRDASASTFLPKKLREDYHAATSITGEKSFATIHSLILKGSSVPSGIAEPQDDGLTDSMSGLNLRTCPPSKRYVISSDDSYHSDSCSEVNFFARSTVADTPVMTIATTIAVVASVVQVSKDKTRSGNLETFGDFASVGGGNVNAVGSSKLNEPTTSLDSFYAFQDLDSETLHNIYVPKWKVTNDSVFDDQYVCRDFTERLDPPALFSQLRSMDYDQLYIEFNVGATQSEAAEAIHISSQLYVVEAVNVAKSTELRDLKERNFALEGEKDALSEKVATLESMTTSKKTELASLTPQRDRLADQRSSLKSAFKLFEERMEAMQDEQATVLGNRVAELDAQLLEMAAHLDEEFYPRFLTTISGR